MNSLSFVVHSSIASLSQDFIVFSLAGPNYPIQSAKLLYVIHAAFRERGTIGLAAANNYLNRLRSLERSQFNSIIYSCEPLILSADPENLRNVTYQRSVAHKILCDMVNAMMESENHLHKINTLLQEQEQIVTAQQLNVKMSELQRERQGKDEMVQNVPNPNFALDSKNDTEKSSSNDAVSNQLASAAASDFVTADELFVTPACWKNPKQNYAIVQSIGHVNGKTLDEPMLIVYAIVSTEKQANEFMNLLNKHSPKRRPKSLTEPISPPLLDYSVLDSDKELQVAHQWRNLAYRWALSDPAYPYLCVAVDEPKTPWVNKSKDIKEIRVFDEPNNPNFDKGKGLAESETQAQNLINEYAVEERRRLKACQDEKIAEE